MDLDGTSEEAGQVLKSLHYRNKTASFCLMLQFLKLLFPVQVSSLNVIFHILKHEPDPLYIDFMVRQLQMQVLKLAAMCFYSESWSSIVMSDPSSLQHINDCAVTVRGIK